MLWFIDLFASFMFTASSSAFIYIAVDCAEKHAHYVCLIQCNYINNFIMPWWFFSGICLYYYERTKF